MFEYELFVMSTERSMSDEISHQDAIPCLPTGRLLETRSE